MKLLIKINLYLIRLFIRLLMKVKIIILLLAITAANAQNIYQHSSNGEMVKHSRYSLSYIEDHEQAEWVYYTLNSNLTSDEVKRSNYFREDYSISTGSAKPNDYKNSGYDRGHLAPAGDMKSSQTAMSESFLMSNISPQNPSFNRGRWKKLETLVRSWSQKTELHIITGGILAETISKIGINGVSVPKYFYKIVYSPKEAKMIGFVMPNSKISLGLTNYLKSVDEIEILTGIDFFFDIEDSLENKLEAKYEIIDWDF